mmetsp:Transcript_82457/g.160838  ORF Transcript_82457/g.160838 Transcript_82457/m.160838 type:complete len:93 (-) Transcript_82457:302-580(-)
MGSAAGSALETLRPFEFSSSSNDRQDNKKCVHGVCSCFNDSNKDNKNKSVHGKYAVVTLSAQLQRCYKNSSLNLREQGGVSSRVSLWFGRYK